MHRFFGRKSEKDSEPGEGEAGDVWQPSTPSTRLSVVLSHLKHFFSAANDAAAGVYFGDECFSANKESSTRVESAED